MALLYWNPTSKVWSSNSSDVNRYYSVDNMGYFYNVPPATSGAYTSLGLAYKFAKNTSTGKVHLYCYGFRGYYIKNSTDSRNWFFNQNSNYWQYDSTHTDDSKYGWLRISCNNNKIFEFIPEQDGYTAWTYIDLQETRASYQSNSMDGSTVTFPWAIDVTDYQNQSLDFSAHLTLSHQVSPSAVSGYSYYIHSKSNILTVPPYSPPDSYVYYNDTWRQATPYIYYNNEWTKYYPNLWKNDDWVKAYQT